jgi:hypothetical protein
VLKHRAQRPHETSCRAALLARPTRAPIRRSSRPRYWPGLGDERWGLASRLPRWRAFDGRVAFVTQASRTATPNLLARTGVIERAIG